MLTLFKRPVLAPNHPRASRCFQHIFQVWGLWTGVVCLNLTSGSVMAQTSPNAAATTTTTATATATAEPLGSNWTGSSSIPNLRSANPSSRGRPGTQESGEAGGIRRMPAPTYVPGEFETYVQKQSGLDTPIRRFGADLVTDTTEATVPSTDSLPAIPADYLVRPGDEIALSIWGGVDADLLLPVDRSGRITVPRVGAISVGGVRQGSLGEVISLRISQTFRNFQLSASISQSRPIRIFVTGFAQRPGSLTLNGLSTITHALMRVGGPNAAGSFRQIQLRRNGKVVTDFDLYDLVAKGERQADQLLQPDDVLHIGPVGPQVALIGSVNQPAVFELKSGETLADLIQMAGGFNAVADRSRAAIERLTERATGRVVQIGLEGNIASKVSLAHGDLVRVFSAVRATLPQEQQNKRIRIEGEVRRPGDYVLAAGSTLADAVEAAQGFTPGAYVFGTELLRESVREVQAVNYERALRDLEDDLTRSNASRRVTSAEESAAQSASANSNARLIERMRQIKPTGRVVMQIKPEASALPDLPLEDGDRMVIPPRNSTVGVFGSVFSGGSFVYVARRTIADYLRIAGGAKRGADESSMFLIRADGTVISARQDTSFWSNETALSRISVLPGDTLFVPEEMNKSLLVQDLKDWTQILYQFGLGLAGIKSLGL